MDLSRVPQKIWQESLKILNAVKDDGPEELTRAISTVIGNAYVTGLEDGRGWRNRETEGSDGPDGPDGFEASATHPVTYARWMQEQGRRA